MIFFSVQECHSPYIPWRLQRIHRRAVRAGNRALPTARDLDADTLLGAGWLPLPPSLPAYWKPFGFAFKLKCNQIELGWMKGWWKIQAGLTNYSLEEFKDLASKAEQIYANADRFQIREPRTPGYPRDMQEGPWLKDNQALHWTEWQMSL